MDEISVTSRNCLLKGMTSPTFLTNSVTRLIQRQDKENKQKKLNSWIPYF